MGSPLAILCLDSRHDHLGKLLSGGSIIIQTTLRTGEGGADVADVAAAAIAWRYPFRGRREVAPAIDQVVDIGVHPPQGAVFVRQIRLVADEFVHRQKHRTVVVFAGWRNLEIGLQQPILEG